MRRKTGKILGISIDFDTKNTILEEVRKGLRKSSAISYQLSAKPLKPLVIVTPNPEQLVLAHENPWFAQLLNRADVALPDGIGLVAAMRLLVKLSAISYQLSAIERIPGVEFMEDLVGIAAKERVRIGLIGGTEKVAVEVFECLRARWSGLSGWAMEAPEIEIEQSMQNLEFRERDRNKNLEFRSWNVENNNVALAQILHSKFQLLPSDSFDSYIKKLAEIILATQTQMVFVALGAPKQEIFIQALSRQLSAISSQSSAVSDQLSVVSCQRSASSSQYKLKAESFRLKAPIILMSVGGAFDMIAGKTRRAPVFIRTIGCEWLYRLILEPWRWRRQLALLKFIFLCIRYH